MASQVAPNDARGEGESVSVVGKLKEGGGEAFLEAISDGIHSGDFKYLGQGTLKKGMEAMNIYRGQGLPIVTKTSGEGDETPVRFRSIPQVVYFECRSAYLKIPLRAFG